MIADLNRYIEMLKISPKSISLEGLRSMPDGKYRCYTWLVVKGVRKYQNQLIVITDNFLCRIEDFDLPVFEGDVILIRNFTKTGNFLSANGEIMISRKPIKVKIAKGKIPVIKGVLITLGNDMKLKVNSREFPIVTHNGWREVLSKYVNREVVIRNTMFDGKQFLLGSDTEVYLEK